VLKLDGKDPSRQKSALEIADKLKRSTNEVLDLEDVATGRAATLLADTLERLDKAHALLAFETLGVTGGMSLTDTVRRTRP
jgi:hypothetical protein